MPLPPSAGAGHFVRNVIDKLSAMLPTIQSCIFTIFSRVTVKSCIIAIFLRSGLILPYNRNRRINRAASRNFQNLSWLSRLVNTPQNIGWGSSANCLSLVPCWLITIITKSFWKWFRLPPVFSPISEGTIWTLWNHRPFTIATMPLYPQNGNHFRFSWRF